MHTSDKLKYVIETSVNAFYEAIRTLEANGNTSRLSAENLDQFARGIKNLTDSYQEWCEIDQVDHHE